MVDTTLRHENATGHKLEGTKYYQWKQQSTVLEDTSTA